MPESDLGHLAQLEAIYDSAPVGLCVLDRELRYVRINRRLADMHGVSAAEHLGRTMREIVPDLAPTAEATAARLFGTGQPALNVSFSGTTPARPGVQRDWVEQWLPLKDAAGAVVGINVAVEEVTERKRIETRLRAQNAELGELAEAIDLAPALIRRFDGTILFWNTGAERLYGWPKEAALGQVSHALFQTVFPKPLAEIEADMLRDGSWTGELQHRRQDGSILWVASYQAVHYDDAGAPASVVEVNTDITDRQEALDALRKAHEQLEDRVKERTLELRTTVQELQTEIRRRTEAETHLRQLSIDLTRTEQREHDRLAHILHDGLQQFLVAAQFRTTLLSRTPDAAVRDSAQTLRDLLDQAITASRSLTVELSPPALKAGGLIPALEWLVRWMAETHHLTVHLHVDTPAVPESEAITVLLFQAIRELLFNIVKHAGVQEADVAFSRTDGHIQVVVSDAGRGFDPDQPPVQSAGGMGLSSIRQRLDFLGGQFDAWSRPGEGSRFTLTVPSRLV